MIIFHNNKNYNVLNDLPTTNDQSHLPVTTELRKLQAEGIPGSVHGSGEGGGSRLAVGRQSASHQAQGRVVLQHGGLEGHVGLIRRRHLSVSNTNLLIIRKTSG